MTIDWLIFLVVLPIVLGSVVALWGFSGCTSFSSDAALAPPAAPTGLSALAVGMTQMNLSWQNPGLGTEVFALSRALEGQALVPLIDNLAVLAFADSGLQEGTTYIYEARSHIGFGAFSTGSNLATTTTVPAAPTNFQAIARDDQTIQLTWQNGSAKAVGFLVEHRPLLPAGQSYAPLTNTPNASFLHENLIEGSGHQYRLTAVLAGRENSVPKDVKSTSVEVSATTKTWKTTYAVMLTSDDDVARKGFCMVQKINAENLQFGGTKIRLTLRGPTASTFVVDKVTVSRPALPGAASNPTPEPFDSAGGSVVEILAKGLSGVTVAAGSTVVLDPTFFTLDLTAGLLVGFDVDGAAGNGTARRKNSAFPAGVPAPTFYAKSGAAEASKPDRAGPYQEFPNTVYLIEKIEVL